MGIMKLYLSKKNCLIFLFITLYSVFFIHSLVFAQVLYKPQIPIPETKFAGPVEVTGTTLAEFIQELYKWAVRIIAVLAVIMIMVAGFQWMTAMGNPSKIAQAKDKITSSLMALILVLGAHFLFSYISPALVHLKNLEILKIEKVELRAPQIDLSVILAPIDWYAPPSPSEGGESFPGARKCGVFTKDEFNPNKRSFYGVECEDAKEQCLLNFELQITQEEFQKLTEGEITLDNLIDKIKKKKGVCVNMEGLSLRLPAVPDNSKTTEDFYFSSTLGGTATYFPKCGTTYPMPITAGRPEKAGVSGVCRWENMGTPQFKWNTKFCVIATLDLIISETKQKFYYMYKDATSKDDACFFGGRLMSCPLGELRRYCAMCGNRPDCTDEIMWTEETMNKKTICCGQKIAGGEERFNFREIKYVD